MARHANHPHTPPAAPAPHAQARARRERRAGLTLAELSVSLAVIATLMVATGSIMVLTGRAVAITAAQASEARIDDVVATMASEQRMALTITEHTPTSITFTVADRDGDGAPETIRYAWSGVQGQPVTKQVNSGAPVVVARDVNKFSLNYVTRTQAAAAPAPDVESTTDDLFYSHESAAGANYAVSTLNWCAQSFVATLPANASSWRVTQVEVMGTRTAGATGSWTVSLCPVDATGKPNTIGAIEKVTFPASSIPTTLGWTQTIKFTNVDQKLKPTDRYCIVVSQTSPFAAAGSISVDGTSADATGVCFKSGTAGGLWTMPANQDVRIRVRGRYKYPGP